MAWERNSNDCRHLRSDPACGQETGLSRHGCRDEALVEQIDGFLSVERFQSLTNPEKLLSVSFFRDEAALNEWRQLTQHRKAQRAGRSSYFRDYRLRVAQVVRDYGMDERDEAPADSRDVNG